MQDLAADHDKRTKKMEPPGSPALWHEIVICHRHVPILRKDQVIENRDIQEGSSLLDLLGNLQVSLGGLQVAGRMVVSCGPSGGQLI